MTVNESEILRLLTDQSAEESWMNRQLGAQLAGRHNLIQFEHLLVRLLTDRIDWVRYHAFQALVALALPHDRLLPITHAALKDRFFRLRQAAATVLEELVRPQPPNTTHNVSATESSDRAESK